MASAPCSCVQLGLAGLGRPVRPDRRRGRGLAAPGLGPASLLLVLVRPRPVALHPVQPARLRRARRGDRRRDHAVHGRGRPAAAGHGERAGVPRPARRRGGPRAAGGPRLWPLLAAVGVVLLTEPWHGGVDPLGVGFALAAAVCWAAYILLTQRVGDEVSGLRGLAVSMPVAGAGRDRGAPAPAVVRPADAGAAARSGWAWRCCCRWSRSAWSCWPCAG